MTESLWLIIGIVCGLISIGVAVWLFQWVKKQDPGTEEAQKVAGWIKDGAISYLKMLYRALLMLALVMALIIAIVFGISHDSPGYGFTMALAFLAGAFLSSIAGYMGMAIAVEANVRSATAAEKGLAPAFNVAFKAGAVLGLAMVGVGVVGMCAIYYITRQPEIVLGFSFGASMLALLAKAGGGIYTKTADIAADLVGKVEVGIPEDDPRNPAVIADNVGDNVGDVAGMGADIFDSYVASAVAVMLFGLRLHRRDSAQYIVFPLILCTLGLIASLIGIQLVRVKEDSKRPVPRSITARSSPA